MVMFWAVELFLRQEEEEELSEEELSCLKRHHGGNQVIKWAGAWSSVRTSFFLFSSSSLIMFGGKLKQRRLWFIQTNEDAAGLFLKWVIKCLFFKQLLTHTHTHTYTGFVSLFMLTLGLKSWDVISCSLFSRQESKEFLQYFNEWVWHRA